MIAGKKKAAAANKALPVKRRGLRVINRCSPLLMLWANPRLRLPPESHLRHSLQVKQYGTRQSSDFRGPILTSATRAARLSYEQGGVKPVSSAKNRPEVSRFALVNAIVPNK